MSSWSCSIEGVDMGIGFSGLISGDGDGSDTAIDAMDASGAGLGTGVKDFLVADLVLILTSKIYFQDDFVVLVIKRKIK